MMYQINNLIYHINNLMYQITKLIKKYDVLLAPPYVTISFVTTSISIGPETQVTDQKLRKLLFVTADLKLMQILTCSLWPENTKGHSTITVNS